MSIHIFVIITLYYGVPPSDREIPKQPSSYILSYNSSCCPRYNNNILSTKYIIIVCSEVVVVNEYRTRTEVCQYIRKISDYLNPNIKVMN